MDDNCCNSGIVSTTSGITADEETCPGNDDQLQMSLISFINLRSNNRRNNLNKYLKNNLINNLNNKNLKTKI
jgi:hypothetical protein